MAWPRPCESGTSTGLVGWWKFDETSGTTAADGSTVFGKNTKNGTLNNFALSGSTSNWVTGKRTGALNFDGTNDYVDVANNSDLDNLSAITVTAWIKPTTFGGSSKGRIVDKGSGTGCSDGNECWTFSLNNNDATNALEFYVFYRTVALTARSATNTITTGVWQHVAVVWDGSTSSANVKFYINGALVSTQTVSDGSGSRDSGTGCHVLIGDRPATTCLGGADGTRQFNGNIDDVRIYNRALSAAEVRRLYIGNDVMGSGF